MAGQCSFRNAGSCSTDIPSTPGAPLLPLTLDSAFFRFSLSRIVSIVGPRAAGLSGSVAADRVSVPRPTTLRASPFTIGGKANSSWIFCRMTRTRRLSYLPLPLGIYTPN